MDCLTFIASIVASAAWPISAVLLALIFKKDVVKAIHLLKRLKAGPLEAEFDREVQQLKESRSADLVSPSATSAAIPPDPFFMELAKLHPRSAILEAWVRLEAAARAALPKDTSKGSPFAYVPAAKLAEDLVGAGKIDQGEVTVYHELRRLRNDVAHLVGPEPTLESVRSYVELAVALQRKLERA